MVVLQMGGEAWSSLGRRTGGRRIDMPATTAGEYPDERGARFSLHDEGCGAARRGCAISPVEMPIRDPAQRRTVVTGGAGMVP